MPERLTEAEVAAVRERWDRDELVYAEIEAWAIKAGAMGNYARHPRSASHCELGRLLATLEASEARVRALTEVAQEAFAALDDGCAFCARISHDISCGVEYSRMAAARDAIDGALTRGEAGTDGN